MSSSSSSSSAMDDSRIDLASVSITIVKALRGFSHPHYPIFLNQNTEQNPLSVDYRVVASVGGRKAAGICPTDHGLRIVPILRFGQTPNAVPEPAHQCVPAGAQPRRMIDVTSHTSTGASGTSNTLSFRVSADCLSTGGFESTLRLRLLVLHPSQDIVLAFVDSARFVVMTRELPSVHRMITYLRDWGFPIAREDSVASAKWREKQASSRSNKKRKLAAPAALEVDDEQDPNPLVISMPDGKYLFTLQGAQRLLLTSPVSIGSAGAAAAASAAESMSSPAPISSCRPALTATPVVTMASVVPASASSSSKKTQIAHVPVKNPSRPRRAKRHFDEVENQNDDAEIELGLPIVDSAPPTEAAAAAPIAPASSVTVPDINIATVDSMVARACNVAISQCSVAATSPGAPVFSSACAWSASADPLVDDSSRAILDLGRDECGIMAAGFAKAFEIPLDPDRFAQIAELPMRRASASASLPAFGMLNLSLTPASVSMGASVMNGTDTHPRVFGSPIDTVSPASFAWPAMMA